MNSTVEKFNQKIEELKKRLKAISTSQNILSKLNALEDYFKQIQDYLNSINTSFSDHITKSEDYSENIATLQSQIADVQQQIQNLPDLEDLNLTQMQADISTLQNDLSTLKGSSNSSISNLETQIATVQADISTITAQISTLQSNVSKNSSDISTLKTTTQNHSTTLTNLTSSQNTLSSTVSNINNRLTSAENELSAITGGVDLTELNEKANNLEKNDCFSNSFAYKKVNLNITPKDLMLYTREYYYCCRASSFLKHKIKLNYMSESGGTMTINLLINGNNANTYTIDLEQNPNGYTLTYIYLPSYMAQTIKLNIDFTQEVSFDSIEFLLYGQGVNYFNYYKDVVIHCFDGCSYISKIKDGMLYYDKISSTDTIDLSNLTNSKDLTENESYYMEYCPYVKRTVSTITSVEDGFIYSYTNGNRRLKAISNIHMTIYPYAYTDVVNAKFNGPRCAYIDKETHIPYMGMLNSQGGTRKYDLIENVATGEWVYANIVKNNNRVFEDPLENTLSGESIALNEDGYMYYLPNVTLSYGTRIGKGITSTAYKQPNGDVNVYISTLNSTKKYKLSLNEDAKKYESTFVLAIEDCDCVYETFNNTIVKHIVSSDSWVVEILEY